MARRIVEANGRFYRFSPDDEIPLGGRYWAILQARIIDEMTGQPPTGAIRLESDLAFSTSRIASDGLVGLVGIPLQCFPSLAANNYSIQLTVRADGYIARQIEVSIADHKKTIVAPVPTGYTTVLTLNNTDGFRVGESLLVGPLGPSFRTVQIRALGPNSGEVTFRPELPPLYKFGDPVVPLVLADFAPTDIGPLRLHREPIVIQGRIVTLSGNATIPITAATVSVEEIWRTPPPANLTVPAAPPNVVSLHPPLYANRRSATSVFHPINLMPVGGEKLLLDNCQRGTSRIQLSNQQNLVAGPNILLIDAERSDIAEYIQIQNFLGAGAPDQPASVTLVYPLIYSHRQNAVVRRVNRQPPAIPIVDKHFSVDADGGDCCVFLNDVTDLVNSATGLPNANGVEISGGPQPNEYHVVRPFSVFTDTNGYYRLPPLSRVAQLRIKAEAGVLSQTTKFQPDYARRENIVDLVI